MVRAAIATLVPCVGHRVHADHRNSDRVDAIPAAALENRLLLYRDAFRDLDYFDRELHLPELSGFTVGDIAFGRSDI